MIGSPFKRAARRQMRANAKTVAPIMARAFTNCDPATGRARTITDPRAVKVLEQATRRMLIEGGAVQVTEVTREVAATLNNNGMEDVPPSARHFVAVGLDLDLRATYALRHLVIEDRLTAAGARRVVEGIMEAAIAPLLLCSGWEACA